jgi:hypothetical protein
VTDPVPWSARRILHQGVLCYVAVRTASGPHLTPVVYVFDGGRVWLTTSRRSVKARTWKRDRTVGGLIRAGEQSVTFRGRVRTYDAIDPLSWPAATVGGPWLIRAATRFTFKNARFFAGYAVDAGRVPLAWSPAGRVFARVGFADGWVVSEDGALVEGWGDPAPRGARFRRSFHELPRVRGVDLGVPAKIRRALGASGTGALALQPEDREPLVLPVRWRRVAAEGAFDAVVPRGLAELSGAGPEVPAALTLDHASAWRASDMSGMVLRGSAALYSPGEARRGAAELRDRIRLAGTTEDAVEDAVLIRLRPSRVVWWLGWTSGTVA